jgi:hypothetical protein
MRRRRCQPDPDAVLAALGPEGERAAREWLEMLGLDRLSDCPPLELVVLAVATLRLSVDVQRASPRLSATDAFRLGAESLGLDDDGEARTHPADGLARTLRNWVSRARQTLPRTSDDQARD